METVTGDKDRISELPDGLLVKILSLLPTTEDAYRTQLVSKRWHFLCTLTDNLAFSIRKFHSLPFINYVFGHRSSSKIRKFHLVLEDMDYRLANMERWLSYVVKHKVEHVILTSEFFAIGLPQFLCTCSSLVELNLSWCTFDKGVVISWQSLKRLQLLRCGLRDEETVQKLLSGCPALETLELANCDGFRHLEINNPNLKRLSWIRGRKWDHYSSEISAPYLQHLEINGGFEEFSIGDVSSLVNAALYYDDFDCKSCRYQITDEHCCDHVHGFLPLVQDYLQKLRHLTKLTITTWFAEVLFVLQLDGVQLPDMKCKCLALSMHITKYNLYGVACLFQASPHVETLNIDLVAEVSRRCHFVLSYLQKGDNMDIESCLSNFTFPNLKSVTIICSKDKICQIEQHDKLFELSEILLKNAVVLEKFVFIAKRSTKCWKCSENCASQYLSKMVAKLLGCPRSSANSVISFRESDFVQ